MAIRWSAIAFRYQSS